MKTLWNAMDQNNNFFKKNICDYNSNVDTGANWEMRTRVKLPFSVDVDILM